VIRAVFIRPDGLPVVVQIPDGGTFTYLCQAFPDGFGGIRLGRDVVGYVGDCSLLDGSPPNAQGLALADAVYRDAAGRPYHTDVRGPMVVLGLDRGGNSVSVPKEFLRRYLPTLAPAGGEGR
jgi:hypothetical protein